MLGNRLMLRNFHQQCLRSDCQNGHKIGKNESNLKDIFLFSSHFVLNLNLIVIVWNKKINIISRLLWYYSSNHRVCFISVRLIPNARLSGQIVLDLQPVVAAKCVRIVGHVKVIYRHLYDITVWCLLSTNVLDEYDKLLVKYSIFRII